MVAETTQNVADEELWRVVMARDAKFDGAFVYAVSSTHVYCRPSCPSRRPRRNQVAFYPVPEVAERMGFRACRRCRPDQDAFAGSRAEMVRAVCRLIRDSSDSTPTLAMLGDQLEVSPHHLQKTFKSVMGISPRQYADACRLGILKSKLKGGWSVADALYEVGYGSSSRLYEPASAKLGMTPAEYGRGGRSTRIAYVIVDCPMGLLLVAATERGICSVTLGDGEDALIHGLFAEYYSSDIRLDGDGVIKGWVDAILDHLSGNLPLLDLPLDIRATAFERAIWGQLQKIPFGETRSYGEVATALGRPNAARAVARACGANPVALVIPCHRVVRQDGTLGGYRWGIERKAQLLAQERRSAEFAGAESNDGVKG